MFSIVMPVWNKRPFVEATLASVLAQDRPDFELIAVDDGSTDGSFEILHAVRDPRVRLIAQANAGPGAARNAGIEAARSDWIAFLDADDLWLPDHLAELDRIRARHGDAGLIAASYFTARNGRHPDAAAGRTAGRIGPIDFLAALAGGTRPFTTSSCAIQRQVYRDLGGFGAFPSAQDCEYWARIALERPIAVSSRRTVIYLLDTGGITDRLVLRPRALPLRETRDLSPLAAFLVDRGREPRRAGERRSIEGIIAAEFRRCLRKSARIADVESLRGLRTLELKPRGIVDRLLLAIAALPRPAGRALCRSGFPLWRMFRPLRSHRRRRALLRELDFAAAAARPARAGG